MINILVMSWIKQIKEENTVFGLRRSRKFINLKDLHRNSTALAILFFPPLCMYIYILHICLQCCCSHQIKQHSVPWVSKLQLGADYPEKWRKLSKYRVKNKLPLQLKQRTIIVMVTIKISKIRTLLMCSLERQGVMVWNFI